MKGHRLFDRFGFNLPKTSPEKESKITKISDYDKWTYDSSNRDWFSEYTGAVLADFQVDTKLLNQLDNNIYIQLA